MNETYYQMYLDELKAIKPCDDQEREALLPRAVLGDEKARERLIEGHLIFALAVAKDFRDKGVQANDLVQEANLALTVAVAQYTEGDFLVFARDRMLAALQDLVAGQEQEEKVGEEMAARVNVLQEVSKTMAEELGREATVEELAQRMRTTSEDIRGMMKMAVDALQVLGDD